MINNPVTLLLLITHFVGDYHLQSEHLSDQKDRYYPALLKHLAVHGGLLALAWLLTLQIKLIPLFLLIWLGHIIIDHLKVLIQKDKRVREKYFNILYLVDQAGHLLYIFFLSQWLFPASGSIQLFVPTYILKWLLLALIITKPANMTFKILFGQYQNYSEEKGNDPTVPGAGAMIGNLERILSAIFLSLNALSSIGLIYTAKSIARFKRIEENQGFAEYYLIGTLFSILFVVITYFLIF